MCLAGACCSSEVVVCPGLDDRNCSLEQHPAKIPDLQVADMRGACMQVTACETAADMGLHALQVEEACKVAAALNSAEKVADKQDAGFGYGEWSAADELQAADECSWLVVDN